jgi:hypothetical protein
MIAHFGKGVPSVLSEISRKGKRKEKKKKKERQTGQGRGISANFSFVFAPPLDAAKVAWCVAPISH